MKNVENEIHNAYQEIERLKVENDQLRQLLQQHQIEIPNRNDQEYGQSDAKEAKLRKRMAIFKSLFKGRSDVFAYRWKLKNGKVGYSPAKKSGSGYHIPLTDQQIYDHLSGEKTIGLYPLLLDNTCWFLVVDFDKKDWKKDVKAFIHTCKMMKIPFSMERSRSGNGAHIWIFFSEPVLARVTRKLGKILLAKTKETFGNNGLNSYDRLFPNQDTMPEGKLGNLIALPLQGIPRKQGNSIFIDENFQPYSNQWLYLSNIKKLNKHEVELIVKRFDTEEKKLRVHESIPHTEKMPKKINVIYKNGIYILKQGIPGYLLQEIVQLAKFSNPAFYKAEKKRLSTKQIPRIIDCSEETVDQLLLPRGCMEELVEMLKKKSINIVMEDETNYGIPIGVEFQGELSVQQMDALQQMQAHHTGVLSATTGFGKTVVAASMIAKRNVNTLVIVHRNQLMEQWKERLAAFLDIDPKSIGIIGGGKNTAKGILDIATIQSLSNKGDVKDIIQKYGQVIVDECHHFSAFTFEKVLKKTNAAYVYGLTATPKRKDGHESIMKMQLDPIRYKVTAKDQAKVRPFKHILIPRFTSFKSADSEKDIQELYSELVHHEARNDMIFNDVLKELDHGSFPIILTERIEHVKELEKKFQRFVKTIIVLTGELSKKEKEQRLKILETLSDNEERLVIATGKYIGEGFDNPCLDTMFLTMPISWPGTLQQYVGRLHRLHADKTVVKVYDYVDVKEAMFEKMYKNRRKGYKSLGYVVAGAETGSVTQQLNLF
ncbi:DEAD/DEAH box helicase [Virgibacillus dakarensis]|uniref:DEAD/DEAH box helicase n=1 Tax=Virgibacillus dakarensis TaxID=1917889 RepID=UPI000B42DAA6|nr:DEAD/DEAH box helicase [Virgibacillus dakarensis]